jgi:hypothetical protein
MSPWPGAPKSQQAPIINPPSTRFTSPLNENSTMGDVADAMRTAFNGLTVHEQAFANLKDMVTTAVTTSVSAASSASETVVSGGVTGVTSFNTLTGAVIFFPGLGKVNDQLGETAYTTQPSDNGAKIVVGDASPVTITLNAAVTAPWFAIIDNDSSAMALLSPSTGDIFGATSIPPSGFGIVFFDGANWWSDASGGGNTLTLTTTGSSGPATLSGDVLNIPIYVDSGATVSANPIVTNSNGSYRLWSDGWVECWGSVNVPASGTNFNTASVVYPNSVVPFLAAPVPELTLAGLPSTTGDSTTPAVCQAQAIFFSGFDAYMARVIVAGAGGGNFDQAVTLGWYAAGMS